MVPRAYGQGLHAQGEEVQKQEGSVAPRADGGQRQDTRHPTMNQRRWCQGQARTKQAKLRNKSTVAQGIYLGKGTKFCETADKESEKEAREEQKGGQHKQGLRKLEQSQLF